MARIDALTISINGRLDPSVLAAVAKAELALKQLGASARTQSAVLSRIYRDAFDGGEKVIKQTSRIQSAMQRIAEIGAGVSLGQGLISGLETGAGLIEKMVGGMVEFSKESMDAASSFELLSRGMGALLRDQGFAVQLLNQLQNVAYKSPFQLTDLGTVARSLTGRGMDKNRLFGATTELGDISAGLGGGPEILDRLALAYGEAFDEKTVTKRVMNQFATAGVPILDALMKSFGMDPAKASQVQTFFKMIHDKQVTFESLDKAVYDLTHNGGLFTDGMLHFAETFKGILTTFEDMWKRFERDFGDIINDWAGMLLQFVNKSGVWDDVHNWFVKARQMSDSVRTFAMGLSSSFPIIDKVFGMFDKFNAYIGSFFTSVDIQNIGSSGLMGVGGGSRQWVLNAMGDEKIGAIIDKMKALFNKTMEFMTGDAMQRVASWTGDKAMQGLKLLFRTIEEIVYLMDDLIRGDLGKFASDFKKYEFDLPGEEGKRRDQLESFRKYNPATLPWDSGVMDPREQDVNRFGKGGTVETNTEALKQSTDASEKLRQALEDASGGWLPSGGSSGVGSFGGNYGIHGGMSGGSNQAFTTFGPGSPGDQPGGPTYDSDSYNHRGHIQGKLYSLSAGDAAMHAAYAEGHYHIKPGETYKSDKDGKLHRWRDTTGAKNPENEDIFVEKPGGASDSTIEEREKTQKPAGVTMNFHIHAIDSDSFSQTIHKHAEVIADHVSRVMQSDWERAAVV